MSEISYVNTTMQSRDTIEEPPPEQPDQETPTAIGRNSAKAEAVVLCLKNILADDPNAKALVFSTVNTFL